MDRSTLLKLAQLTTVQVFYIKKASFYFRDSFLVFIIIIAVSTISIMLKLVTVLSTVIIMFEIKQFVSHLKW